MEHQLKLSLPSFTHTLKYKMHRLLKVSGTSRLNFKDPETCVKHEEVNCYYLRYLQTGFTKSQLCELCYLIKKKQNKKQASQYANPKPPNKPHLFICIFKTWKDVFLGFFLQLPQWIKLISNLSEQFLTAGVYCASSTNGNTVGLLLSPGWDQPLHPSLPFTPTDWDWDWDGGVVQVLLFSDPNPLTPPPPNPTPKPAFVLPSLQGLSLTEHTPQIQQ